MGIYKIKLGLLLIFSLSVYFGCNRSHPAGFEAINFAPIRNFPANQTIDWALDYSEAIDSGFVAPSKRQAPQGFEAVFQLANTSPQPKRFYYKLYYQNEAYKFGDTTQRAEENFYGSDGAFSGFTPIDLQADAEKEIHINYRIAGNPRDEERYFAEKKNSGFTEADVNATIQRIRNAPDWFAGIAKKAKENNVPLEKQLVDDARWVLQNENARKFNQRSRRNPRTGAYKFLLVVASARAVEQNLIPQEVQSIGKKNKEGRFVNPFGFYAKNAEKLAKETQLFYVDNALKLKALPDPGGGVFVDKTFLIVQNMQPNRSCMRSDCGDDSTLHKKAAFQQFIHYFNPEAIMDNIPLAANLANYSRADYNENGKKFGDKRVKAPIQITDCPCKTVKSDAMAKKITMFNPAVSPDKLRKENVGVWTRHGFTYGKYTAKVKMPRLLNKHNVWNGLTNAIWLINESQDASNSRRECAGGYIPKRLPPKRETPRSPTESYSEIDFEIVKCPKYWPQTSYGKTQRPAEPADMDDKVVITCTNWDLACRSPKNYISGAKPFAYNGQNFELHRWDDWYQALTSKYVAPDAEIFGTEFYFQIEWKPNEIIWRIGPTKDKLQVCGAMTDGVTEIPNNQMLMVFTQEYHLANWWPESAFSQNDVPFPAENLTGEILSLEIE